MAVVLEGGLYHIELSARGIGGLACKRLLKTMLRSVTNVRDMFQTSTNYEES